MLIRFHHSAPYSFPTMPPPTQDIRIFSDHHALMQAAAEHLVQQGKGAIQSKGKFYLALAGGSTPKHLYTLLARPQFRTTLDWHLVDFFWGDERHVPPDHPDSNYRMAFETLLHPLAIPDSQIHRMRGEEPVAQRAADHYENLIRSFFKVENSTPPQLDLVLLGLGPDGHTASLFPETEAVHETHRWVAAPWVAKFQAYRITMTPPLLNQARQITFLVSGSEKAEVLRAVLEGDYRPDLLPAQIIRPIRGHVTWLLDEDAAQNLSPSSS